MQKAWCEANTAMECNDAGSAITTETDCGDDFCIDGECQQV